MPTVRSARLLPYGLRLLLRLNFRKKVKQFLCEGRYAPRAGNQIPRSNIKLIRRRRGLVAFLIALERQEEFDAIVDQYEFSECAVVVS